MITTKADAIAAIVRKVSALELDELVMWHCYHKTPDDHAAQKACEPAAMRATKQLISELPDVLEELVAPAFFPVRTEQDSKPGSSRFGGVPDVSPDFEWPSSDFFSVGDACREFAPASLNLRHFDLQQPLPMTFVTQIDLEEVSGMEAQLPDSGRLLVFMDYALWFNTEKSPGLKIVWDETPVTELVRAETPEALSSLDKLARRQFEALTAEARQFADELLGDSNDMGLTSVASSFDSDEVDTELYSNKEFEEPFHSGFLPPEFPVFFDRKWVALGKATIEVEYSVYSKRVASLDAVHVVYECEQLWSDEDDKDGPIPLYHQFLGKPYPEQDDPRYDAFYQRILGRAFRDDGDFDIIREKCGLDGEQLKAYLVEQSKAYKLLLQLDVASFLDMNSEGVFYIFLHQDDLQAREFSKAVVIYQQT